MKRISIKETYEQIKNSWVAFLSADLGRSMNVQLSFADQLELFFDKLKEAALHNNPEMIRPIIDAWGASLTESELTGKEISLSPILIRMLHTTIVVSNSILTSEQAFELIQSVFPVIEYGIKYASETEINIQVKHIAGELQNAQSTLQKLDKSKSDFISVAAHELKTPLTIIEGYTSMLEDGTKNILNGSLNFDLYIAGIHNGTHRLKEIIDDMIDVSMIDNNLLALNFQPVWIDQLFEVIQNEFTPTFKARRLTFSILPFPETARMTYADSTRLFQAYRNLVLNAIKFTPDNGSITITGRELPGFIEAVISDTGIGIAQENHDIIFDKFGNLGNIAHHSSGKTKYKGGGPGLGLSIAKGIVEAHGGTIWVESDGYDEEKLPGATFHVLIPKRDSKPNMDVQIFIDK